MVDVSIMRLDSVDNMVDVEYLGPKIKANGKVRTVLTLK